MHDAAGPTAIEPAMEPGAADFSEPRQERSVASTARLVEAATDLFTERGYTATTLAAIGERAGYSRGIVTARFGSKEHLAWAVVVHATRQWDEVLRRQDRAGTGLEEVVQFIAVSRDNMAHRPRARLVLERLYSDSAAPLAPLHDRFEASLKELTSQVGGMIRRGVDDGSVRPDVDAELSAGVLIAQLRGIGYQWFLFPGLVDPVAYHRVVADQVVTALSAQP